jgi:hypothetical protein
MLTYALGFFVSLEMTAAVPGNNYKPHSQEDWVALALLYCDRIS